MRVEGNRARIFFSSNARVSNYGFGGEEEAQWRVRTIAVRGVGQQACQLDVVQSHRAAARCGVKHSNDDRASELAAGKHLLTVKDTHVVIPVDQTNEVPVATCVAERHVNPKYTVDGTSIDGSVAKDTIISSDRPVCDKEICCTTSTAADSPQRAATSADLIRAGYSV